MKNQRKKVRRGCIEKIPSVGDEKNSSAKAEKKKNRLQKS